MTRVAALLLVVSLAPAAGASPDPVRIPSARVGDVWTSETLGETWRFEVGDVTVARDRWGRLRETHAVAVEGFHPVAFEGKELTEHTLHLDVASGTQVADVAAYVFSGGGGGTSDPAAYVTYEPNNPDGWLGWVSAGGLLAGRELLPGGTVTVPFVMTSTRGGSTVTLSVTEVEPIGAARCVRATGGTSFPSYSSYTGSGYGRGSIRVALDLLQCEDRPYARTIHQAYSGAGEWDVTFTTSLERRGTGAEVGSGPYEEPARHTVASFVPFDGSLRDGGSLEVPSLEAAQAAAGLAPGLLAWRVAHLGGYLVEAEHLAPEMGGMTAGTFRWRLVYAAPGGAQHQVVTTEAAGQVVAVDRPSVGDYPAPVPPLAEMPSEVVSPAGAVAAWRAIAGPRAWLTGLRWQPLLDDRWYVMGGVEARCGGTPCGTLFMQMPFDHDTGAAGTGEFPLPLPEP